MNSETLGITAAIPEPLEKALPIVRRLLSGKGLSVIEEFDVSGEPSFRNGTHGRSCVILMVDMPVLLFEAVALDRAAAVFLPLHVVISGDGGTSYVHWVHPILSSGLRPPAPARAALEELCGRVTAALSALRQPVVSA